MTSTSYCRLQYILYYKLHFLAAPHTVKYGKLLAGAQSQPARAELDEGIDRDLSGGHNVLAGVNRVDTPGMNCIGFPGVNWAISGMDV